MMRSCAVQESECVAQPSEANPQANTCDLKLFVVWTGTDTGGNYFLSASRRFSRFRMYGGGLGYVWERVKRTASDVVNRLSPDSQINGAGEADLALQDDPQPPSPSDAPEPNPPAVAAAPARGGAVQDMMRQSGADAEAAEVPRTLRARVV
jgi:hypothetical protein